MKGLKYFNPADFAQHGSCSNYLELDIRISENVSDQEVLDARAKLAARFGKVQIGGKGSQRRIKKFVHKQEVNPVKKLKAVVKKFGMQSLQDYVEVNMFKDDNTVIHLN